MNLSESRERPIEQRRIKDILDMTPPGKRVLDIGARDGYLSRLLSEKYEEVTALDLEKPNFTGDRIVTVQGNVTALDFPDGYFDTVFCAEVLEHIPPELLQKSCSEIARVARSNVVIGVPYKQDTRVGRLRCSSCGKNNPPWGHVNEFDEQKLGSLFKPLAAKSTTYIGTNSSRTNAVSSLLMDMAGNPYGTYQQEEACVHCNQKMLPPARVSIPSRILAKLAVKFDKLCKPFRSPTANWIHVHFTK